MRALIVSLGSIGRRHLSNLRALRPDAEIGVLRERASACPLPGVDRVCEHLDDALGFAPQVAIVAGPATRHIDVARPLAESGAHLLIEKPISHRMEGVDELIEICRVRSRILMVGYVLRFSPAAQRAHAELKAGRIGRLLALRAEVGQHLEDWRPAMDYRESVSARSELGGGALLELSHELDLALWLAGAVARVSAESAALGGLEIDVEDCAELLLAFQAGAVGSIHVDMLQRPALRRCTLIGERGRLELNLLEERLVLHAAGKCDDAHELYSAPTPNRDELYRAELAHFLSCAETGAQPCVTGEDGRAALALALAAKRSALTGQRERL
jgi:predicted dehydrogenase